MSESAARPQYGSVARWAAGLAEQWGGNPLQQDPAKLETLLAFCRYADKNPDELLDYCFLRRRDTGDRFLSKKRREEITSMVTTFLSETALKGVDARRTRSTIYSFLSHNGVLI